MRAISTLASWRLNPSMHVVPISSTGHILHRPDAIIHKSLLITAGLCNITDFYQDTLH